MHNDSRFKQRTSGQSPKAASYSTASAALNSLKVSTVRIPEEHNIKLPELAT